ncbi:MAG TPA: DUF6423 family protein [Roseiflexaceae bacterium]|nr:DUF6423 family protein [Roseiflexaceae bacterium]
MRAKDLQMAATIDPVNRIILVSGGIDRNEHTIVLRVPIPEPGLWTVIKAEVNLTDEPWTAWQITLGEGVSVPTDGNHLLMSRQFKRCKYLPERGAILFTEGEVRPGDAIFKMARLQIEHDEMVLSHNRATPTPKINVEDGFGETWPRIEVIAPVRIVQPGETDLESFEVETKDALA